MRCSQLMAARLLSTSSTSASVAAGQPSTSAASSSAGVAAGSSIYTACVLERLPVSWFMPWWHNCLSFKWHHSKAYHLQWMHMPVQIVEPAAPQWEVEHNLWLRAENLRDGFAKEYPKPVRTSEVVVTCTRRFLYCMLWPFKLIIQSCPPCCIMLWNEGRNNVSRASCLCASACLQPAKKDGQGGGQMKQDLVSRHVHDQCSTYS